ncbi:MAG: DUF917 family protein [Verrucomicrobium sp.]|nr:DUF917 family protein [Verrucomicrobium sp.]
MSRILTRKDVEAAVKGGSIYASGGGGWVEHGLQIGGAAVAIGQPELVPVSEVPNDAVIVTTTAIGAPAGTTDWQMLGVDYVKAVQLLQEAIDRPIFGVMTPQNGMSSSINGWLPAALLGLKVIDATGDIRAHPTGDMGAMGLASRKDLQTVQTLVGGKRETGSYVELVVRGTVAKTSAILRTAADQAGGFAASARLPIDAAYVKQHGAIGGITSALRLGEAIVKAEESGSDVLKAILSHTGGTLIGRGTVTAKDVAYTNAAFDIGRIEVGTGRERVTLHVMNEHMAVDDADGRRIASYPDVITTLTLGGHPLSAGQVQVGAEIVVLRIEKSLLPMSSSVTDPTVYPPVEKALGINLADYALDGQSAA